MKNNRDETILHGVKQFISVNAPLKMKFSSELRFSDVDVDMNETNAKIRLLKRPNLRFALAIIFLCLFFSVTVIAFTTPLFQSDIFDLGVKSARKDGKANDNVISAVNNGITVEVCGTVSDRSRTVFEINVYGLNNPKDEPILFENIQLKDEDGNEYIFNKSGAGGVVVEKSQKGTAVKNSLEFYGGPEKDMKLYLSFDGVNDVKGSWSLTIPIVYYEEKVYETDIRYEMGEETWIINKISLYASQTVVEGVIESTKDWDFTMELSDQEQVYKGFSGSVVDRKLPTSFEYNLEPMKIKDDIKLYILNLNMDNNTDVHRAEIDIYFSQLKEIGELP